MNSVLQALTTRCIHCNQFATTYDDGDTWTHTDTGDIHCNPRHSVLGSVVTPKLDY